MNKFFHRSILHLHQFGKSQNMPVAAGRLVFIFIQKQAKVDLMLIDCGTEIRKLLTAISQFRKLNAIVFLIKWAKIDVFEA